MKTTVHDWLMLALFASLGITFELWAWGIYFENPTGLLK